MTFNDCIKRGLIKKSNKTKERIEKELNSAEHFLKSAKKIIKINEYDISIISSYNSCFHYFRALLFNKKYIEKSHFCLIEAIRELYDNNELSELADEFDKIRMSRHEIQYRGIFSDKDEAEYILDFNQRLKKVTINILKI